MKISIGADHRGFALKSELLTQTSDLTWIDRGTHDTKRVDYPVYAHLVCQDIQEGNAHVGVLLCGSGVGISIAANRNKGIYAALCWCTQVAQSARADDGANILVLPADFVDASEALKILRIFLATAFKGGVYAQRLSMIDK